MSLVDEQLKLASLRRARWKSVLMAVADATISFVMVLVASYLRYELDVSRIEWQPTIVLGLGVALFFVTLSMSLGLYLGKYAYGSFDEIRALTVSAVITSAIFSLILIFLSFDAELPRSLVIIAFPLALVSMFGLRCMYRLGLDRTR